MGITSGGMDSRDSSTGGSGEGVSGGLGNSLGESLSNSLGAAVGGGLGGISAGVRDSISDSLSSSSSVNSRDGDIGGGWSRGSNEFDDSYQNISEQDLATAQGQYLASQVQKQLNQSIYSKPTVLGGRMSTVAGWRNQQAVNTDRALNRALQNLNSQFGYGEQAAAMKAGLQQAMPPTDLRFEPTLAAINLGKIGDLKSMNFTDLTGVSLPNPREYQAENIWSGLMGTDIRTNFEKDYARQQAFQSGLIDAKGDFTAKGILGAYSGALADVGKLAGTAFGGPLVGTAIGTTLGALNTALKPSEHPSNSFVDKNIGANDIYSAAVGAAGYLGAPTAALGPMSMGFDLMANTASFGELAYDNRARNANTPGSLAEAFAKENYEKVSRSVDESLKEEAKKYLPYSQEIYKRSV